MAPTFNQARAGYLKLWLTMKVRPDKIAVADRIAKTILGNRTRYEAIENQTGVPWFMIGAIHQLEAGGSFAGVLHNGEKIIGTNKQTRLVPSGRGPFQTFEEAAIDALTMPPHSLHKIPDWPIERIGYELERYNGFGYFGRTNSPYLWSYSNHYVSGKYIADHVYSTSAVSDQCGAMVILNRLAVLDKSVASEILAPPPVSVTPPPDVAPIPPKQPAPLGGFFLALLSVLSVFFRKK